MSTSSASSFDVPVGIDCMSSANLLDLVCFSRSDDEQEGEERLDVGEDLELLEVEDEEEEEEEEEDEEDELEVESTPSSLSSSSYIFEKDLVLVFLTRLF